MTRYVTPNAEGKGQHNAPRLSGHGGAKSIEYKTHKIHPIYVM